MNDSLKPSLRRAMMRYTENNRTTGEPRKNDTYPAKPNKPKRAYKKETVTPKTVKAILNFYKPKP